MGEGLVGLGHLVRLFLAPHRAARVVHRVHELAGKPLRHRLARARARRLDEPAHGQRGPAVGADLDRHLIGRAADAARLHLDERRGMLQRGLEHVDARLARRRLRERERAVDDGLGGRALAIAHDVVVELLQRRIPELAVGCAMPLGRTCSAGHRLAGLLLGVRVLRAVEAAALLAVLDARGVEGPADDVVLDGGEVWYASATHEDHRVLLEVMADPRDVGRHLHLIGEADAGDLPQGGVRLLRGHGADDRADAALLGRADRKLDVTALQRVPGRPQRGRVHLLQLRLASLAYELRDRWHNDSFVCFKLSVHACAARPWACTAKYCLACVGSPRPRSLPCLGEVPGRSAAAVTTSRRADARNDRPKGRSPSRKTAEIRVYLAAVAAVNRGAPPAVSWPIEELRPSTGRVHGARSGRPVPAGMSLPMMTFSLSPSSRSFWPIVAASVRTRVVSWNDAAARKELVESDAFVTPRSTVCAVAGSPPAAIVRALISSNSNRSKSSIGRSSVSPASSIRTFRSIWRTMISMCLSLIVTP